MSVSSRGCSWQLHCTPRCFVLRVQPLCSPAVGSDQFLYVLSAPSLLHPEPLAFLCGVVPQFLSLPGSPFRLGRTWCSRPPVGTWLSRQSLAPDARSPKHGFRGGHRPARDAAWWDHRRSEALSNCFCFSQEGVLFYCLVW